MRCPQPRSGFRVKRLGTACHRWPRSARWLRTTLGSMRWPARVAVEILVHGPQPRGEPGPTAGRLGRDPDPGDSAAGRDRRAWSRAAPSELPDGAGRRCPSTWSPDARHFVGVKLTRESIYGVLVDVRARVLAPRSSPSRRWRWTRWWRAVTGVVDRLRAQSRRPVHAVGVTVGGVVDGGETVTDSPFLEWHDVPFRTLLARGGRGPAGAGQRRRGADDGPAVVRLRPHVRRLRATHCRRRSRLRAGDRPPGRPDPCEPGQPPARGPTRPALQTGPSGLHVGVRHLRGDVRDRGPGSGARDVLRRAARPGRAARAGGHPGGLRGRSRPRPRHRGDHVVDRRGADHSHGRGRTTGADRSRGACARAGWPTPPARSAPSTRS